MNKFIYHILLFSLTSYSLSAFGQEKNTVYPNSLNRCTVTKREINSYEPEIFQTTNNLLRKTGQVPHYSGQKIIIQGRVLDKNCVPVPDAKVYLWQVGNDGKYPYKLLRKNTDTHRINTKSSSTFTGSGVATTNSNGEFFFITIYPGKISQKIPYVNLRVEHRLLGQMQTKLYLTDIHLLSPANRIPLNADLNESVRDTRVYDFDIVLPETGISRY